MKKLIFLICFFTGIFTISSVHAQEVFRTGDGILNASIGLGSPVYNGYGYFRTTFPPLAVSYEVGVMDNLIDGNASIGVGGYFGFTASHYRNPITEVSYSSSAVILGPRGIFHYQIVEDLDTYAGVLLGLELASNNVYTGLGFDTFIGARYYFQPNLAAMVEIGHGGIGFLNLGVALRLQ